MNQFPRVIPLIKKDKKDAGRQSSVQAVPWALCWIVVVRAACFQEKKNDKTNSNS